MKLCASSQFPFVCLGDCGEVVTGSTPPKANSDFWGGEIPFVTPAQLGFQSPITTADEYVTSEGADRGRLLPEGAVLVCCIGSLGKTGTTGVPLISNQQINAIIFDPIQVDARYGYHVARSLTPLLNHFAPSTTVKIVKKSAFAEFQIPLPPLDEQKRIAGILDAADALRAKRREALGRLDTLVQSTFLDMFGDPVTNPMGWETPALSKVTDEIYRYPTYFGIVYENEGVPEIRGELIGQGGKLDTDPSKFRFIAQATSDKFPRTQLTAGDLVMSVRGTIGKIGIVPAELINANMTANLIRISPARSIIDPVFLLHVALGPYFLNQLSRASSSTTIKTIKALDLRAIPIPRPPLDLQRRFAAIVESIEQQKASQRAHMAELDTLFASLQSRAFRGDL